MTDHADRPTITAYFEDCTGCGNEGFVCVVGNGDPNDCFDGPYVLCEDAFKEWLIEGENVLWTHD